MAAPYTILVLNGPNLGALGVRQPEIYGTTGMDAVPALVDTILGPVAKSRVILDFDQKNGEGQLIDRLETARREGVDGIAFNAGAYTHTSLAIADCLAWIAIPTVEVHISDPDAREEFRKVSYIRAACVASIKGHGLEGYLEALRLLCGK